MTSVLALANQKGGVGKTTTAINLGAALAEAGHAVLIVDIDPQANATSGLRVKPSAAGTIYDVLLDGVPLADIIRPTPCDRLSIVPSISDLAGAEVELTAAMAREYRLQRALDGATAPYRLVIIDCPPSVGLLTVNGLTAAQEVIIPVQCEYLALEGLGQFTSTLELVRRNLNRDLRLCGLVLTMYDRRTTLSQQVAEQVRGHFPNTFQTIIPRSVRLSEAPSHGLPIGMYDPRSAAAAAYRALADEVLDAIPATAEVAP